MTFERKPPEVLHTAIPSHLDSGRLTPRGAALYAVFGQLG